MRQVLLSAGGSGTSGLESLDVSELLSALSASGVVPSSNDSLTRIVANAHARARDERGTRAKTSSGIGLGVDGGKSDKNEKTKLSPAEDRNRIYTQMREAERECYELNRRINAWTRLNENRLKGSIEPTPSVASNMMFLPSTCSSCSLQVAHDLLSLLHSVYANKKISQWEHTVTIDLVKLLLKESELSTSPKYNDLRDLKRQVIITLASSSGVGSKMILAELRLKLTAVQDVTSAEILGMLVELDFPFVDDYIELAVSTLSSLL